MLPLEWFSRRRRGEWRLRRHPLGLIVGYRNLWRQRLHLLPAEQRFHLVLRQVFPVRIAKRDSSLPREPDAPRRPGVKREPIPRRLAAESSLWRPLVDVVLQKERRRQLLEALREARLAPDATADARWLALWVGALTASWRSHRLTGEVRSSAVCTPATIIRPWAHAVPHAQCHVTRPTRRVAR
jgi:hypothetical protein